MPNPDQTLADLFADVAQIFGLSRPAGQCFSAIWRAAASPCADDLVSGVGLSRSNVSTALKELRAWNLIGTARAPGDRKDYFTAPADPWDLLGRLLTARQRMIVAPVLDRIVAAEAESGDVRMAALHEVLDRIGTALGGLATQDAAELARRFDALGQTTEKPRKKKKKH